MVTLCTWLDIQVVEKSIYTSDWSALVGPISKETAKIDPKLDDFDLCFSFR